MAVTPSDYIASAKATAEAINYTPSQLSLLLMEELAKEIKPQKGKR